MILSNISTNAKACTKNIYIIYLNIYILIYESIKITVRRKGVCLSVLPWQPLIWMTRGTVEEGNNGTAFIYIVCKVDARKQRE